jgi:hypothetical protein
VETKITRWSAVLGTAVILAVVFLALAPSVSAQDSNETPSMSPAAAKRIIKNRTRLVIQAIRAKNTSALAAFVHPSKGLRFSPYTYVDQKNDLVFKPEQLKGLSRSQRRYHWGEEDGSGDPIRGTFSRYYRSYIYDKNFAIAPQVTYNEPSGGGTMISNIFSSYPGAIVVDYYFPPTDGEMDWRSLRLIFQKQGSIWFLVGLAHNEWTI